MSLDLQMRRLLVWSTVFFRVRRRNEGVSTRNKREPGKGVKGLTCCTGKEANTHSPPEDLSVVVSANVSVDLRKVFKDRTYMTNKVFTNLRLRRDPRRPEVPSDNPTHPLTPPVTDQGVHVGVTVTP